MPDGAGLVALLRDAGGDGWGAAALETMPGMRTTPSGGGVRRARNKLIMVRRITKDGRAREGTASCSVGHGRNETGGRSGEVGGPRLAAKAGAPRCRHNDAAIRVRAAAGHRLAAARRLSPLRDNRGRRRCPRGVTLRTCHPATGPRLPPRFGGCWRRWRPGGLGPSRARHGSYCGA